MHGAFYVLCTFAHCVFIEIVSDRFMSSSDDDFPNGHGDKTVASTYESFEDSLVYNR